MGVQPRNLTEDFVVLPDVVAGDLGDSSAVAAPVQLCGGAGRLDMTFAEARCHGLGTMVRRGGASGVLPVRTT